MALPLIPIGILWIIGAAATIGILAGVVVFFVTKEGTAAILFVSFGFIALLLIPFLPSRWKWARALKRKLRHVLKDEPDNAD